MTLFSVFMNKFYVSTFLSFSDAEVAISNYKLVLSYADVDAEEYDFTVEEVPA